MREKQNNWQRIEAVIKWANMSTNYFALYIGLARGENLYQIKRGNNGISLDVADRIVSKFPQVDRKSTRLNSSHTDSSRMPSSA